jgi:hypothetical protein
MSLWEYKVITSGKGGFARPDLMEKFLNDLGRDEWEIIQFHSHPDNFLAFTGLARRSTQRDWTLEDAAAAAAKVEAEKLRAEFEAKFKAAASPAPAAAEERAPSFLEEKSAPDDGLRKLVDTSRDDDPEAQDDDKADDWDKLTASAEEELPTFFEAMRPHMRRNQRGPGMSVGVDYLAKKWDQSEDDLKGALAECGFVVPADEDAAVEYLEYDGDLFWLNINRRGELWINTKEKPRPVFRPVKATRVEVEAPKADAGAPKPEAGAAPAPEGAPPSEGGEPAAEGQAAVAEAPRSAGPALPEGPALLEKIRPHMRRNRRGPGGSGSMSFLSRALRTKEANLKTAIAALGLPVPAAASDKLVFTEIGNEIWWFNLDSRAGLWINGREKKEGEVIGPGTTADGSPAEGSPAAPADEPPAPSTAETMPPLFPPTGESIAATPPPAIEPAAATPAAPSAPAPESAPAAVTAPAEPSAAPATASPLAAIRLLLKETKTGAVAGKLERLAEDLGKSPDELLASLVAAGLKAPEKPREKPVFVEHAGEILWFNKNAKGELWLNAKASKFADKDAAAEDESAEGDDDAEGDDEGGEKKSARRGSRAKPKKAE